MKRLILAFIFFVVCVVFLFQRTALRSPLSFQQNRAILQQHWAGVFGPGRPFPPVSVDREGRGVGLREVLQGNWSLLIYASLLDEATLGYPLLLLDRYRSRDLNLVCILPSARAKREINPALQWPGAGQDFLILTDSRGELRELLESLGQREFDGFALVDPEGMVRFSVPRKVKPETMRQVVERHLLGRVAYRIDSSPPGYATGATLPEVALRRISDGEKLQLSELHQGQGTVIFFQGHCAACLAQPYLQRFQLLAESGVDFAAERIYLVFSKAHWQPNLDMFASTYPFLPDIYQAEDYVAEWEDPYNTIADDREPATVLFAANGKLSYPMSFRDWFAERTGPAQRQGVNER